MEELKKHQSPMTVDEQINNLKSLGLIISDEEYAKRILNDISYFRLIKAYSLGFKKKNGKYNYILKKDNHWNLYVEQIETLIDKYEKVNIKTMGFPDAWKELLAGV